MSDDAAKQAVLDFMHKSSKKKLSVKDVTKGVKDFDRPTVKNALKALELNGEIKYWSSGSTVYVVLPENYQDAASEH